MVRNTRIILYHKSPHLFRPDNIDGPLYF